MHNAVTHNSALCAQSISQEYVYKCHHNAVRRTIPAQELGQTKDSSDDAGVALRAFWASPNSRAWFGGGEIELLTGGNVFARLSRWGEGWFGDTVSRATLTG